MINDILSLMINLYIHSNFVIRFIMRNFNQKLNMLEGIH
jgi:hypothetical protein